MNVFDLWRNYGGCQAVKVGWMADIGSGSTRRDRIPSLNWMMRDLRVKRSSNLVKNNYSCPQTDYLNPTEANFLYYYIVLPPDHEHVWAVILNPLPP